MNQSIVLACVMSIFLAGCTHYHLPILTQDHPACPTFSSPQPQLSSILETE